MAEANKKYLYDADSESGAGEADLFRNLALRYTAIGAHEGIKVTPFEAPEMPLFQKATPAQRKTAIEFLGTIVQIHEETIAAGDRAIDSRKLVWRALSKLSLVPGPEIFNFITEDDVVLIYQENQTVVFWNLQFFQYASLTVEQLFFEVWHEFTKRDIEIQKKLYQMALDLISGKITGVFSPDVPGHVVEELGTVERLKTWMEIPYASSLTKNGAFGGILVIKKMKII